MEKLIKGQVFVVGDDVDTDQIIPAQYLSYNPSIPEERKYFGKYALSGVPIEQSGLPKGNLPFVEEGKFASKFVLIVAWRNFGCGSSREHAPLALAEAGVKAVVAQSYARIFFRNSVNGGYLAPFETPVRLVDEFATGDKAELDVQQALLRNLRTKKEFRLGPLGEAGAIIEAGGIFNFAKKRGLLR